MTMGLEQGCSLSLLVFGFLLDRVGSHVAQPIPPNQKGNALLIANFIVQLVLYAGDLSIFASNASALKHILT